MSVPKISGVGLQAEQRMVGSAAVEARIVTDQGVLLVAEDGDDGAIEIEDEARAVLREMDQAVQQSVVCTVQLEAETIGGGEQEASQGLRIGKARQAGKILEGTIGTQD